MECLVCKKEMENKGIKERRDGAKYNLFERKQCGHTTEICL